jgi:hypothetical protein
MNLYYIDGGTQQRAEYEDYENNVGHWEYYDAVGLYAANSRGHAHGMFCAEFELDWTDPVTIRLIEKDLDIVAGQCSDDILWIQAMAIVKGYTDAEEFYHWQAMHDYHEEEVRYGVEVT